MELVSACLGFQPRSSALFNQEADVSSLTGGCLIPVLPILGHIPQKADFSTPSTSEHDQFKILLISGDWP